MLEPAAAPEAALEASSWLLSMAAARINPRLCSSNPLWLLCTPHLGTKELSGMRRIAKLAWLVREILAGDCTRRQENAWKEAAGKAEERLKKIEMGQCYRAAVP